MSSRPASPGTRPSTSRFPRGLARVYAYDDLGSYLALPLAQFAAGPAVLFLGLHATLYAAAALILLATLAMVATPSIRALVPKTAEPLPASKDPVPR
ncbi:hypothetical protein ACFWWT_39700 [Streptomyces sp. NPDC058676]|uniref:hypothetical protein n=1 Tax=unclassified Streptomyces TaxID=2593676 RepID=UPI0036636CA5